MEAAASTSPQMAMVAQPQAGILSKEVVEGVLNLGEDLKCPICLDLMSDATQLPCCHFFCWECINMTLKKDKIRCPVCKAEAKRRDLVRSQLMQNIAAQYTHILSLVSSHQASQPGHQPGHAWAAPVRGQAAAGLIPAGQTEQNQAQGTPASDKRRLRRRISSNGHCAVAESPPTIEADLQGKDMMQDCSAQLALRHSGGKRKDRALNDRLSDGEPSSPARAAQAGTAAAPDQAVAPAQPQPAANAQPGKSTRGTLMTPTGAFTTRRPNTGGTPDPITSETPSAASLRPPHDAAITTAGPSLAASILPAAPTDAAAAAATGKGATGKRAGLPRGAGLRGAKATGRGGRRAGQAVPATVPAAPLTQVNPLQITRITRPGNTQQEPAQPAADGAGNAASVGGLVGSSLPAGETRLEAAASPPPQPDMAVQKQAAEGSRGAAVEGGREGSKAAEQANNTVHPMEVDANVMSVACTPPEAHQEQQEQPAEHDPALAGPDLRDGEQADAQELIKAGAKKAGRGRQARQVKTDQQQAGGSGAAAVAWRGSGGGIAAGGSGAAAASVQDLLSPGTAGTGDGTCTAGRTPRGTAASEHKRVLPRLCKWKCPGCTLHNESGAKKCVLCKEARPRNAELVIPTSHSESLPSSALKLSGKRQSDRVDRDGHGSDVPLPTPKRIGLHTTGGNISEAAAGAGAKSGEQLGGEQQGAGEGDAGNAVQEAPAQPGAGRKGKQKQAKAAARRVKQETGEGADQKVAGVGVSGKARGRSKAAAAAAMAADDGPASEAGGGGGVAAVGSKVKAEEAGLVTSHKAPGGGGAASPWGVMSHFIILGSGLSDAERADLKQLSTLSGCQVVDSWRAGITHVTCGTDDQKRARRTIKYLMGIAHGCWVTDASWVRACLAAGAYTPPDSHEVGADAAGGKGGPQAGRTRSQHGAQLLNGVTLVLTGPFPTKSDITALAKASGATVLPRPPVASDGNPAAGQSAARRKRAASQTPKSLAHALFGDEVAAGAAKGSQPEGSQGPCGYALVDTEACKDKGVQPLHAASNCAAAGMQVLSYKWLLDCVGSQVVAPVQPHVINA